MFVTKITKGSMLSKGIDFKEGVRTSVNKTVFDYLQTTFPKMFKFEQDKPKPKQTSKKSTKVSEQKDD